MYYIIMVSNYVNEILTKAEEKHILSESEIVYLLENANRELFSAADKVRKLFVGDAIHLRGLIEFSNICKSNCMYCGLRSANKEIERYRLTKEQILNSAKIGVDLGYKTIVLQSGEDAHFSVELMCEIISDVKQLGVAVTLGIGERSFDDYKAFKDAGADRYLIRIETSDKKLYEELHPNMSFDNRVRCLKDLKTLGFEVGSGCLVGLPNQSFESLAKDILFFKEMDFDMIGIGPLITHPQTPLANYLVPSNNFETSLKVMAITRLLLPDINIPATTAMETLSPNGRILALQSGANVVMPNITDIACRPKYEIYPNKSGTDSIPSEFRDELISKIHSIGRFVATDFGFRK